MMKKLLLVLVALVGSLAAWAQSPTHVRVTPVAGSEVVISFASSPEFAFLADGVMLSSKESSPVTFQFDEIKAIDFVNPSSVEGVEAEGLRMAVYPDRVEFLNVPDGADVRVYNMGGSLVKAFPSSGTVTLFKADFPKGVYVVTIADNSFKLTL